MKIKEVRAIDANRFKDNILSGLYVFCQENKEDIARAIDDEPTLEIPSIYDLERLQGEWKYREYNYYCSNCNKSAAELEDYPFLSNYCPHCGAYMELEN